MSEETSNDAVASPLKRSSRFQTYKARSTVTPEQAKRQGHVLRSACRHFSGQTAITFLNGYDEALGGKPLQIAMQSDEGLARVEQLLDALLTETDLNRPQQMHSLPRDRADRATT